MKILREIKEIDKYLLGEMDAASRLVFDARVLIDPVLKARLEYQRRLYTIIKRSGRRQIKAEVSRIHHQLFTDPARRGFQSEIFHLFSKK